MHRSYIHNFSYTNRLPQLTIKNPILSIDNLKDRFPKEMINEMIMVIKKHKPEATEEEIVTMIMNNK